jgi:GDP-4-dehydro-6-deoxy-D-mannose reductase
VPAATLVTGAHGFAGQHLTAELSRHGAALTTPTREELDLHDPEAVRAVVGELRPRAIHHLAGFASVRRSWDERREVFRSNVEMTLNLLEAVRRESPESRVLVASSGEVYGVPERLPVDEGAHLRPQNPYAVSKAACDLLAGQYGDAEGLQVVRTRAFNHAGPGQSDEYVVGTLTRQVAEAELAGREEVVLRTGDVEIARDFTDVRDVARAYVAAIELPPGAYNVCTGRSTTVAELVELLRTFAEPEIRHEVDPARVRTGDVREIRGSFERLRGPTGWAPEISLADTVRDALDSWRARLSYERTARAGRASGSAGTPARR